MHEREKGGGGGGGGGGREGGREGERDHMHLVAIVIPVGKMAAVFSCACHKSAAVVGSAANCTSSDCCMLVRSLYGRPVVWARGTSSQST